MNALGDHDSVAAPPLGLPALTIPGSIWPHYFCNHFLTLFSWPLLLVPLCLILSIGRGIGPLLSPQRGLHFTTEKIQTQLQLKPADTLTLTVFLAKIVDGFSV